MAEEAIARARAIAARLGAVSAGGGAAVVGGDSSLGKRKNRWDDDNAGGGGGGHYGLGSMAKQKVYVPVRQYPETNWIGLLIGPRGKTQKELEQRTGAKIIFRGRGSSKDGAPTGHPDDEEELHVSVEGSSDSVEKAVLELEEIFHNPEKAGQLKQQQLRNLADLNSSAAPQSQGQLSGSSIYGPGYGSSSGITGPVGEIRQEGGESICDLEVPNHLVGFIIGKGGENIVKMQTQTGGHIQIAKESEMKPGDTMRRVTIRGSDAAVKDLKRRIEETVSMKTGGGGRPGLGMNSGPKEQRELDTAFVLKVVVPNDKVGLIIGKGGATVKMIQDRTNSNVQIPPNADEDNPAVRTLSIGAETREAVEACQMEIFNTLQQQQQQLMSGTPSVSSYQPQVFTMAVPDDRVGIVIGKGGSTIKDLQSRYGVRIQIPGYADVGSMPPIRTVSITGCSNNEHLIKQEIESLLMNSLQGGGGYGQQQHYGGGGSYYQAQPQAQGYYGQTQQSYYGQTQQAGAYGGGYAATDAYAQQAAADPSAVPTDPTAYYPDFWNYASLYGEAAARLYYTTWSPPEGTPPPAGIVLPFDASYGNVAAPVAAVGTVDGSNSEQAAVAADDQSPEAIAAAWEVYNTQYAEWMMQQAAIGAVPPQPEVDPSLAVEVPPPPP